MSGLDQFTNINLSYELSFANADIYNRAHHGTSAPLALPLFLTAVQAGFPSPAEDYIERRLDLVQSAKEACAKKDAY